MRTNLHLRLKSELKLNLENNRSRYPDMIHSIEHLLSQHLFYTDLTIGQIKTLMTFAEFESHDRSTWNWRFGEDLFTMCNEVC